MSQIITQPETSEKTLLTYSALNTFRNCPRKYKNRYLDNLRPRERAEALSFGSVIHTAIELWYRLPDTESRLPDVLAYIDDAFENRVVDPNQMVQWHLATANRLVVTINSFRNELNMIHKQLISACALMLLVLAGCDSGIVNVRALPTPEPEQPPANLPVQLHQRNWTGSLGQGSCVHASLVNHLRWLNSFELGERWRTLANDLCRGEWDSRLRDRLDAAGIDYSYTLKADPRFLDWASATRRGAILWWKPAHCCTFVGWIERDGKQYAAILDNKYPGRFELTPREQFIRLWAGYGGFALTVLNDPSIHTKQIESHPS